MHNHHQALAAGIQAERLAAAARRLPPADAGQLERMVRAAADGDAAAWHGLVTRFHPRVLRAARATGLSHHDAQDAAQATWMRLFRHIRQIREARSLPAWLATAARREGLRLRHRAPRDQPIADELLTDPATAPDHDRELMAAARSEAIAHALRGLPDRHQAIMHALTTEPAPSYAEVAARLGIPIGSIGPIRARCLARLRGHQTLRQLLDADV